MTQSMTQVHVDQDISTTGWIQRLAAQPPDQAVEVISSADERYRIEDDDYCDDDGTSSMTSKSKRSYVSAGDKNHNRFQKQLLSNGIVPMRIAAIKLSLFGLDGLFTDDALVATAHKYLERPSLDKTSQNPLLHDLKSIGDAWDAGSYNRKEWQLHHVMHRVLINIIEPGALDLNPNGWKTYEVTSPGSWNRAPKVFIDNSFRDLSMPTVDTCFSLAIDQENHGTDSPLRRVCEDLYQNAFLSGVRMNIPNGISVARASELLSLSMMRRLNNYPGLLEVCFCPSSQVEAQGNYPVSWYELKWTPSTILVAVNQNVNAGVAVSGKMIDLVLEAKKCGGTSVSDEPSRIVTLGMSIAGKEWRIDAVVLNMISPLETPSFVYFKLTGGDWQVEPKKFIGAVITMHEFMLSRTVSLVTECLDVLDRWVTETSPESVAMGDSLPERTILTKQDLEPKNEPTGQSDKADTIPTNDKPKLGTITE